MKRHHYRKNFQICYYYYFKIHFIYNDNIQSVKMQLTNNPYKKRPFHLSLERPLIM